MRAANRVALAARDGARLFLALSTGNYVPGRDLGTHSKRRMLCLLGKPGTGHAHLRDLYRDQFHVEMARRPSRLSAGATICLE